MRMATLIVSFLLVVPAFAVDPKELKRGLIATTITGSNAVRRFDPTIALNDPALRGNVMWKGFIYIVTPGNYTFTANLDGGEARLIVNNSNVTFGKAISLEAGPQPITATFQLGVNGQARWELLWQGPGFGREPIPYFFLSHVAADRNAAFLADRERELGRFLFEEHGCKNCHTAKGPFVERKGPSLVEIGKRVYPGWLDAWLADPAKLRPHTTMPAMFVEGVAGQAERYAVVQYLKQLGGTINPPSGRNDDQSIKRGEKLFLLTGCAACHANKPNDSVRKRTDDDDPLPPYDPTSSILGLGTATGPQSTYALGALGSKTTPSRLAEFLQNPHANNPTTRMPNMALSGQEARDLANFLCRTKDDSIKRDIAVPKLKPGELNGKQSVTDFDQLADEKQWIALGEVIAFRKGCANCHDLPKPVREIKLPSHNSLADIANKDFQECVSVKVYGSANSAAPAFPLSDAQRRALNAFLKSANTTPAISKTYEARIALKRFNCLNCHIRDGEGGIAAELADKMKALESAENADDVRPPSLTHIGHKATKEWLTDVLIGKGRARPWMGLRMPQYGEAHVGLLVDALPRLEGVESKAEPSSVPFDAALVTAGRALTGKDGYGCIACHDISGVVGGGTRGPDLALTQNRIRPEWFERWMHNPQRMSPGTKMPQYFLDGKATNALLGADPAKQIDAFRAYFSLGMGLPLPVGLEPPKGVVLVVKDRPELLRTFMPDGAGTRSIAVGYPGHVNIAYDSTQARIAYAWAGNFLDASPVWTNRGGNPAKLLGPKFWTAPAGHPWTLGNDVPDFTKQANDPAFGGIGDPDKAFNGTPLLTFDGYSLDAKGNPTFRSTVRSANGQKLMVSETPRPLASPLATGFARHFELDIPEKATAWFLAATGTGDPRIQDPDGTGMTYKGTKAMQAPAEPSPLILPQASGGSIVLTVPNAKPETTWRLVPDNGTWQAILQLPPGDGKTSVTVHTWVVTKDDFKLIRELK